uniref:hypothetical protein n=1 Tax=Porodaedalea niemelaei TaxID=175858 RepID=UPI0023AAAAEB|nr:hypothetical protein P1R16_mgp18 [Porodaedalea niemelaei]WCF76674.1 hypothetical protein [Porodaedalea niemelaei]
MQYVLVMKKVKSFYLTDYNNDTSKLVKATLRELFSKKNHGKTVYIHNSSSFNLIFLLKYIIKYPSTKVKPVVKDGKFINIEINFNKNYKLNLRDSILLLPGSLDKLSKQFNGISLKGIFPYSFVTPNNLNYIGSVPSYNYFDQSKVSEEDYNNYCKDFKDNNWDLKAETIKYCSQDCRALYQVIKEFGLLIFKLFNINILTVPTLPSLAFKIYRTKFFPSKKEIKIPVISDAMFNDLKKAYYGGHCDEHPLLPYKVNESTVYGVGTWEGWYYSEELKNAAKYGYTYEIKAGYLFEGQDIFSNYVKTLSKMKENSTKGTSMYLICKLLLNALYGRYGMDFEVKTHLILDQKQISELIDNVGEWNIDKNNRYWR